MPGDLGSVKGSRGPRRPQGPSGSLQVEPGPPVKTSLWVCWALRRVSIIGRTAPSARHLSVGRAAKRSERVETPRNGPCESSRGLDTGPSTSFRVPARPAGREGASPRFRWSCREAKRACRDPPQRSLRILTGSRHGPLHFVSGPGSTNGEGGGILAEASSGLRAGGISPGQRGCVKRVFSRGRIGSIPRLRIRPAWSPGVRVGRAMAGVAPPPAPLVRGFGDTSCRRWHARGIRILPGIANGTNPAIPESAPSRRRSSPDVICAPGVRGCPTGSDPRLRPGMGSCDPDHNCATPGRRRGIHRLASMR